MKSYCFKKVGAQNFAETAHELKEFSATWVNNSILLTDSVSNGCNKFDKIAWIGLKFDQTLTLIIALECSQSLNAWKTIPRQSKIFCNAGFELLYSYCTPNIKKQQNTRNSSKWNHSIKILCSCVIRFGKKKKQLDGFKIVWPTAMFVWILICCALRRLSTYSFDITFNHLCKGNFGIKCSLIHGLWPYARASSDCQTHKKKSAVKLVLSMMACSVAKYFHHELTKGT